MHGTSFVASLTDGDAPEHRTQQYFETVGNRGMYKDGWWLAMKTERIPWLLTPDALAPYAPGVWDPDAGPAELYYLPDDFTQAKDLSGEHPDKVRELKDLFWQEAERYKVLPLLATLSTFFGILPPLPDQTEVRVPGRRAERDAGHDPEDLQPLLRNHCRPGRARRRRRRCDRGRGRPSRRLHPLRQGRQAHPHLLDDGRVRVQAGRRRDAAHRRGDRPHAVRGRRSKARDRRRRDLVHRRPTGRQGPDGPHRAHQVHRLLPAWTSAGTTVASST